MDRDSRIDHYEYVEVMAGFGSWAFREATNDLWWSPGMRAIFGVGPEVEAGQQLLFDSIVPGDRDDVRQAAARYARTGVPEFQSYRIRRPDGDQRHVWAFGEKRTASDGTGVVLGYVLDVTERQRVERDLRQERDDLAHQGDALFREIVHSAPTPAVLHAEDGALIALNDRWTEITGYTERDIPTIDAWTERAYPEGGNRIRDGIRELFSLTRSKDEGEFVITTAKGAKRNWLFSSAPLGALSDGRKVVLSVAHDVTEERRLARERRAYEREVHQLQKLESLGVLAGGIAHDFNNLLTGVIGNAAVALETVDPESPLHGILVEIRDSAERAASLSRDMLTYAGREEPRRQPVDVDAAIADLRGLLGAVSHRVDLVFELGARRATTVLGGNQLDQAVVNMVTNAAEALDGSRGRIAIRTGVETLGAEELAERAGAADRAQPGTFVFVEVQDNGVGMPAETAARVFEPFFTTRGHGRGLGMAVVLGIVRGANGFAEVDTAPQAGTRVRLSFPVGDTSRSHSEPPPYRRPSTGASTGAVLLVDDEPLVRRALATMLRHLGYRVVAASSGEEALSRLSEHDVAAAVVDLSMPGMSGVDLLRKLKRRAPDLPVLLASGYADKDLSTLPEEYRHDGFIAKPVDLDQLQRTLRGVLDGDLLT